MNSPHRVIKKGIEVITRRDGSKKYKPYAYTSDYPTLRQYLDQRDSPFLTSRGFISDDSEDVAERLLNFAVTKYNIQEIKYFNKGVVSTEDKEIL